ncbi:hypothetical protein [Streptomyces sp. NPDC015130]|uniref:hypothetical protein n=1 Tax=Streptomyces sp. NPDC015130 TaxID=3364940 RepID=UPI0036FAC6FB
MRSPVVGLEPEVAQRLRRTAPDGQLSWADLADAAAAGTLTYAMADPRSSHSGLSALVGAATAAAATGGVLRPEDVSCDRLRGFVAGHAPAVDSSGGLASAYARGTVRLRDVGDFVLIRGRFRTTGEDSADGPSTVFLAPYGDPADPSHGPRVRVTCATEGLRAQVPQGTFSARCLDRVQEWNAAEGVLEVQAMAIFR